MKIPQTVKEECIRLKLEDGKSGSEIYNTYYVNTVDNPCTEITFVNVLNVWIKQYQAKYGGGFDGFTIHKATVQVDSNGNLKQAWIKQNKDDIDYDKLAEVAQKVTPLKPTVVKTNGKTEEELLEISLFDMHFGWNDLKHYQSVLDGVKEIISRKQYEKIVFIVGQDLLHCDNFSSTTTKGTQLPTIDLEQAFADALQFYMELIELAVCYSGSVDVHYSMGNHDETTSWFFFKVLEEKFKNYNSITFDDSRSYRKCFTWKENFIGYSHSDEGRTNPKDIRLQYTSEFPIEFANSKTREIHLGHLHSEFAYEDISGFVVRRLGTSNGTDAWHSKMGYVGNHKRFQIFTYVPSKLKRIEYVI